MTKEDTPYQFDGSETIADILAMMPEASEILYMHGVGCAGCQFSEIERLDQGILGHGFAQEDLDMILADLNEAAQELGVKKE